MKTFKCWCDAFGIGDKLLIYKQLERGIYNEKEEAMTKYQFFLILELLISNQRHE